MKQLAAVKSSPSTHWVGDGFPVRGMFSYSDRPELISPFLLMDYAGPVEFDPAEKPRGVESHPHRGFETVSIIFSGEVSHRDSAGAAGTIGPGDVQWMTAASGVVHEEMHSQAFTKSGGPFEMIQLWINLPQNKKMSPPAYQDLMADQIPTVEFGAATARVIAGSLNGVTGPAKTQTPLSLFDAKATSPGTVELPIPDGWTANIMVRRGTVTVEGNKAGPAELLQFSPDGEGLAFEVSADAEFLILTGEVIDEPISGHGPFVMNTRDEIYQAIRDFQTGKMGVLA